MLPPITALNELPPGEFERALSPLFEGAPDFLRRLSGARPFGSYDELIDSAAVSAHEMPEPAQLELIDCHPRIGAPSGEMSAISRREQGYDRDPETRDLHSRLDRLNDAYEDRFGFRFVVFVAGRPRSEIADMLERSLGADREQEKRRALNDVIAIARDRARLLAAARGST